MRDACDKADSELKGLTARLSKIAEEEEEEEEEEDDEEEEVSYLVNIRSAAQLKKLLSPTSYGLFTHDMLLGVWPPAQTGVEEGETCPACKDVERELDLMGRRVRGIGNIIVARAMRGTNNELDAMLPVKTLHNDDPHRPSVFLLPCHTNHNPVDFDSSPWGSSLANTYSVQDFMRFLLSMRLWRKEESTILYASCSDCKLEAQSAGIWVPLPHIEDMPGLDVASVMDKVEQQSPERL